MKGALRALELPYSRRVYVAYRRINDELWESYRQGKISQPDLARERFRRLLVDLQGSGPLRLARRLGKSYLDHLSKRGDRLPGCRPVVQELGRSYRLGIVTNGIDRVQRSRLEAAGLTSFFEVVVTSQGAGFAKPDPRILFKATDALGVPPAQALYVGDDPATDGGAARAAGMRFCWVDDGRPAGGRRPRFRVTSLRELAARLRSSPARGL